jgi:carbonic anhydrase/acetyltransferase-like protein (isoleucine patch superfamily)
MSQQSVTSTFSEYNTAPPKPGLYRYLATSDRRLPRLVRSLKRWLETFSIPAPRVVFRPLLVTYLTARTCYEFVLRVCLCEPLFKAYCKQYGRRFRTGRFLHYVEGKGDLIIGDNVWLDGKSTFIFAARFADNPTLIIGDNTAIGHDCRLAIAKRISIGQNCLLSGGVTVIDSSGHQSSAAARLAGQPPMADEVRPVVIGDGVWIGMQAMIFPGVKIGAGSVIAAGSVVRTHVPPYSIVAGNPAKVVMRIRRPE